MRRGSSNSGVNGSIIVIEIVVVVNSVVAVSRFRSLSGCGTAVLAVASRVVVVEQCLTISVDRSKDELLHVQGSLACNE